FLLRHWRFLNLACATFISPKRRHSNAQGVWFDTPRTTCRIDVVVSSIKAACAAPQSLTCRSGGIGRRAWFRSMYPQGCGGSSPFFGTIISVRNNLPDSFSCLPHLEAQLR